MIPATTAPPSFSFKTCHSTVSSVEVDDPKNNRKELATKIASSTLISSDHSQLEVLSSVSSFSSSLSSSSTISNSMRMEGDNDGEMIKSSLPPAAEGTETSEEDHNDEYNTKKTKTEKKVRFHKSTNVCYIETKEDLPHRADYWLTPFDFFQMRNDFHKALRQQCPSVQKYQPHQVIAIQRKFKIVTRNVLRQQDTNKRHQEELQKKLDHEQRKQEHQRNKNNIFGFLFNTNNKNQNNNKNRKKSTDDGNANDDSLLIKKLEDDVKTFREQEAPQKIAELYRDITKSDVDDAIQVASELEQELGQPTDEGDETEKAEEEDGETF
mmetsp:Transcript_49708/g.120496  ORF Transcript_49708/g.120496 Transcript_49708/m.120496 type:complete len:324 (+) Transcript_49708:545-1516(+)